MNARGRVNLVTGRRALRAGGDGPGAYASTRMARGVFLRQDSRALLFNASIHMKTKSLFPRWLVAALLVSWLGAASLFAEGAARQLWSLPLNEEAKWHTLTELGVLLVGTPSAIVCINPDTGAEMWRRTEFQKSTAFNAREIPGTPWLLCNTYSGMMNSKTTLHLIDYLAGKTLWTSPEILGQYMGTIPVPSKGLAVLVMTMYGQGKADDLAGIALLGFDLATGQEKWRSKFAKSGAIPLHPADSSGMFIPVMDLSGYHEPLVEGDNLFLPYLGVHCVDLNTGATKWGVEFPPADKGLKKTHAPLRIEGDLIYGAGGGSVYAINKTTGATLWKSERISKFAGLLKARDNAVVAQIEPVGDKVFMRFGGNFSNGKAVVLREPLGLVALDKATGREVYAYEGVKEGITNLLILPEPGVVMFADAHHLTGLDLKAATPVEKFHVPIEFKRKFGGGEVAQLGLGALGGLTGIAKAGFSQSKGRLDVPVSITLRGSHVVVQGKQHLMAFDPQAASLKWSSYYVAPSNALAMAAMFAVTAAQGVAGNAQVATSGFGTSGYSSGVGTIHGGLDNYNNYMTKRGASKTTGGEARTYILTTVEDGKEKGVGLLGIDMTSGDAAKKIILGTKEPDYQVDEQSDRIFLFKDKKTVVAFQL